MKKNVLHRIVEFCAAVILRTKRLLHSVFLMLCGRRRVELCTPVKYPSNLQVEVTNLCNANCVFCGYQYQERPKRWISLDTFKLAVNQYCELGGGSLGITPVVGDPLLDKDLSTKIAYARSVENIADIEITTNAILLTKPLFEKLIQSGLTHIVISMSGFNREEYKRIYRNDSYVKVTNNLCDIAQSSLFHDCKISLSIRTDRFFRWTRKDYWKFKRLGYRITGTIFYDNWSGKIKSNDLPGAMFIRPNQKKRHPCSMLYAGPAVLADGTITACGCRDINGDSELVLGNIHSHRLYDVWSKGKINELRNQFLTANPPTICRDCRHYTPYRNS